MMIEDSSKQYCGGAALAFLGVIFHRISGHGRQCSTARSVGSFGGHSIQQKPCPETSPRLGPVQSAVRDRVYDQPTQAGSSFATRYEKTLRNYAAMLSTMDVDARVSWSLKWACPRGSV